MRTWSKVMLAAGALCLATGVAMADKPLEKPDDFSRGLLDCTNLLPLECNSLVSGDNTGAPNNVEVYSCVSWTEGGGEVVHELILDQTYDLTITLLNTTCDLDVFLLAECDEATCLDYGNTSISGQFDAGTYYVVVDGYGTAECPFDLEVVCEVPPPPPEEPGSFCNFVSICYDWDFEMSDHGFVPAPCGDTGTPVWQYGLETTIPGAPGNVWGTILNGDYLASSGEGLLSPVFTVSESCNWMEIKHYVYTEGYLTGSGNIYDGGNVTVDEIVIPPIEGYDGLVNVGLQACVDDEEVFAGDVTAGVPNRTWGTSCFDLSQFMGMTIQVRFDFGSDSSVQRPGWYLAYVRLGTTEQPVGREETTWGTLKSLYR